MQQVLGYDALNTGIAYLPLALGIIVSAGGASQLVARVGFKPTLAGGLALIGAALVWFAQVSVGGSYLVDLLPGMLLVAVGLGLAFVSVTIAATNGVEEHEAGLASGLINTAQQVGGALGLAVLAAVATARTDAVAGGVQPGRTGQLVALTEGFQAAFLTGAGIALAGVLAALLLIRRQDSRQAIGAQAAPAVAG
jgi:hypothetical protein